MSTLQKQVWPKAKEYFRERSTLAQKVLTKALWVSEGGLPSNQVMQDLAGKDPWAHGLNLILQWWEWV
jgi:hypothetical protein